MARWLNQNAKKNAAAQNRTTIRIGTTSVTSIRTSLHVTRVLSLLILRMRAVCGGAMYAPGPLQTTTAWLFARHQFTECANGTLLHLCSHTRANSMVYIVVKAR